ncbi:MAG TPA: flavin reductase family protein [Solirubrobacteraceae bacterium]|jgi:flavin reductase (DIM6/NTAB) family NADH-FMN oxidoreductase RutF|nr:flavin reductase family protein [Solirubrobacteraceae bacterium]
MPDEIDLRIDSERYRNVLGHLPTGVTVITAHHRDGPVGMSSNSFTSVSLDPPLILFCPAKSSATWPKIRESGAFCVNIFAAHHEQASRQFSRIGIDRFAGVSWHERPAGPALDDAVAWIECAIDAEHEAGDHMIVVGAVRGLEVREGEVEPLVFFRGQYGSFLGEHGSATPPADHES